MQYLEVSKMQFSFTRDRVAADGRVLLSEKVSQISVTDAPVTTDTDWEQIVDTTTPSGI